MKNKKLLSLILALAMAFSLAASAFATSTTLDNTQLTDMSKINTATTTVNGTYQAPVLALTVPKKINLLLNPYGRAVTVNKDTALAEEDVQRQIISADNLIISRSNVPIAIKATATGTITAGTGEGNAWTLAKTPIVTSGTGASTKKEALVYMVFGEVNTTAVDTAAKVTKFMEQNYVAAGSDPAKIPYEGITIDDIEYATVAADLSNVTFADAATAKDGVIIQAGEGKETLITKTLSECIVTEGVDAQGATTYSYENVSAVAFKMDGVMVANPKDASWGSGDKLTVSVAWKFVPDTQALPLKVTEYVPAGSTPGALSINLAALLTDENATAPVFDLKSDGGATGVTLTQAGVLGITEAGVLAQKASDATSVAKGDKLTFKMKVTYQNNDTTPVEVTKNIALTVKVVDLVVAGTYDISDAAVASINSPVTGTITAAALSGAPSGVTVAAAGGAIAVTKAAVEAANGGTAPAAAGEYVYTKPFTYSCNDGTNDVSKLIVLKITAQA